MRKTLLLIVAIFTLSHCYPIHHSYKFEDKEQINTAKEMAKNDMAINKIVSYLGSPSFINSPMNDTICYISEEGKRIAFVRFYNPTYHLLCFTFKEQKVIDVIDKEINNLKDTKFTKYKFKINKKDFVLTKEEINEFKNKSKNNSNLL